jgi:hypothetical protein
MPIKPETLPIPEDERALRETLWIHHDCSVACLYSDDGEMQCPKCGIDFLRWSVEAIRYALENKIIDDPPFDPENHMHPAIIDQPTPSGTGADIATLVQQDIEARALKGLKTYGERLKPNNDRNALVDAYQEALDLCMYLRQKIEEEAKS